MSFYECVGQGGFAWNGRFRHEYIGRFNNGNYGTYGGSWISTGFTSNKRFTKIFVYPETPDTFYSYQYASSSSVYPFVQYSGAQAMQDENGLIWVMNNGLLSDMNNTASSVAKSSIRLTDKKLPINYWHIIGIYPDNTGYRLVKETTLATAETETHSDCIACFPQSDFPFYKYHSGSYAGLKIGLASPDIQTGSSGAGTYNKVKNGFFSTRKGSSSAAYETTYYQVPLWCLKE